MFMSYLKDRFLGSHHSLEMTRFSRFFLIFLFLFSVFNFLACDSDADLLDDLDNDFHTNFTYYSENPSENGDVDFRQVSYQIGTKITKFPTYKDSKFSDLKTGYKFESWFYYNGSESSELPDGWELNEDDGTVTQALVTSSPASLFVADWEPIEYTVAFYANGGSGEMESQVFTYDEAQTLTKNTFERENYTFIGWGLSADQSANVIDYLDEESVLNLSSTEGSVVNLYALWLKDKVTVTYHGNGGTYTDENGDEISEYSQILKYSEVVSGDVYLEANKFKKEGHNFSVWNTNPEGSGKSYSDGSWITTATYPETDVDFYAFWNPIYYEVNLFKNDGSSDFETYYVAWGETLEGIEALSRTGYDFKGWYTSSDDGGSLDSEFDFATVIKEDLNLYAKWEEQSITIHFDKNSSSASGTMADRTFVYADFFDSDGNPQWVSIDCDFTPQNGYMFNGWSVNYTYAGSGYESVTWGLDAYLWETIRNNESGNVELTFYATWDVQHYAVNFELPDGGVWTDTEDVKYQYLEAGSKATKPSEPIKTGYDFDGWFTESLYNSGDFSNPFDFDSEINDNIYLYAHWTAQSLTISYDSNGGIGSMSEQSLSGDILPVNLEPNSFSKEGYDFKGWATSLTATSATYSDGEEISESNWDSLRSGESITLYAVWDIQKNDVVFVDSLTREAIESQEIEYGGRATMPDNPVKEHYTFLGWDSEGETSGSLVSEFDFSTEITSYIQVYAKWMPETYTLTFDGNGAASGSMDSMTFTYGVSQALNTNTFVRTGYNFTGWATSPASSTVVAGDGSYYSVAEDMTLYAVWRQRASTSNINQLVVTIDEENETITFAAGGLYNSWTWLVDGTTSGSGESITLSFDDYSDGKNHFVLLVGVSVGSDGDTESNAESANFKILPKN